MSETRSGSAGTGRGAAADYEVVVVAYRSRALVEELLERLGPDVGVVVVDNAHDADGLAAVARARPGTRYLAGPGGFAAGANAGVAGSGAEVGVVVNPDAAPSPAQIEELVATVRSDPALVSCCGLDLEPDGRPHLGTGGWEPSVTRTLVHVVGLHKVWPRAGLWARPTPGEAIDVDWTGGACTALRLDRFRELGGFAEQYFVYSEDVAFGRAARAAGWRTRIRTDVLIGSGGARTSGESAPRMLRLRADSMMRYLREHHPRPRTETVRVLLTAGTVARTLLAGARGRRGEAIEHVAYVRGLWTGRGPVGGPG